MKPLAFLMRPVDVASVAVFRIALGATLTWQCYRYWAYGWIEHFYVGEPFLFKYFGFSWVHPPPGDGIYLVYAALAACSFLVAIGLWYRVAIVGVLGLFSYVFLLDAARYLNHFYLVILLVFLMCFAPASNAFSVDALRRRCSSFMPAWPLYALVLMMEIMLLYAGIVKINGDWLDYLPLSLWLSARTDTPIIGPWLDQTWVHAAASYFAILLHILGAPLLFLKKTRLPVFCVYAVFHLLNSIFFNIGIFPILTLVATTLFFAPDWPRRWLGKRVDSPTEPYAMTRGHKICLSALAVFLLLQIALPLRHFAYPGDALWTDEGHRFAWRMKLREKVGLAAFYVRDSDTGQQWTVDPKDYLKPRQVEKVATRPDLALQFAHHVADIWRTEKGVADPDVRAWIACSLNGRDPALLIDPKVNLAKISWDLGVANWVTRSPTEMPVD